MDPMESTTLNHLRDLTVRVGKHHKHLEQSEQKFRTLAEMCPVGIFMTDSSGGIIYINRTFSTITGVRSSDEHIRTSWISRISDPIERQIVSTLWQSALSKREQFQHQLNIKDAAGQQIWVIIQAIPCDDGTYCGSLTIMPNTWDGKDRRHGRE